MKIVESHASVDRRGADRGKEVAGAFLKTEIVWSRRIARSWVEPLATKYTDALSKGKI
ncbi:MAG TPA: hypothetical protein VGO43_08940 [Pyrinomonadaceae bacterium]|nr:hypothetical protein [Pyrinomonadaceae bacterium]